MSLISHPWSPRYVKGLYIWLTAGAGVSTSGGYVTGVTDQSGTSGNDVSASGPVPLVTNGINGRPAFSFAGGTHLYNTTYVANSSIPKTLIAVVKPQSDGTQTGGGIFDSPRSVTHGFEMLLSQNNSTLVTTVYRCSGSGQATLVDNPSPIVGAPCIVELAGAAANGDITFRMNGATLGTNPSKRWLEYAGVGFKLAQAHTAPFFNGLIAEFLAFDHVLTAMESSAIRRHLANYYSINISG